MIRRGIKSSVSHRAFLFIKIYTFKNCLTFEGVYQFSLSFSILVFIQLEERNIAPHIVRATVFISLKVLHSNATR